MASKSCACCGTDIKKGSGTTLDFQDFCDDGCAVAYHQAGGKPVEEWPANWPPE